MAKSKPKKIRLKRAKEDKALKSQLKRDIAHFLIDMHFCISTNPEVELTKLLQEGHKGYNNMRNKDLIGNLEDAYEILNRLPKQRIKFYAELQDPEQTRYGGHAYRSTASEWSNNNQEEIHEQFKSRAEGLVGQVLDAIIGLEREELAERPSASKANKRGLSHIDPTELERDF